MLPERSAARVAVVGLLPLLLLCAVGSAKAAQLPLGALSPGQFVADLAGLLDLDSSERLQQLSERLVADKATPIIVATLSSKAAYGGRRLSFEGFATRLFNQWNIGYDTPQGHDWNTGILLLVSKGDHKAWVELGADWGSEHDGQVRQIIAQHIVANFRRGRIAEGIEAGARALDEMARQSVELPDDEGADNRRAASVSQAGAVRIQQNRNPFTWTRQEWLDQWFGVALLAVLVLSALSLLRNGRRGLAWTYWGSVFKLLLFVPCAMVKSIDWDYRYGGYGLSIGRW